MEKYEMKRSKNIQKSSTVLFAAALVSILALVPTAGAAFTEDFNILDYNVWEEFTSGNVNGKSLSTENGKLKIGFSAHDFHPNIGYAGLKTKNKINVIPGTIEFTTELDNTNNPGSRFPEHAPVVVLSTEADPFPGVSYSGEAASFQNALVFYKELSGNRGIVDTVIYEKDGTGTILYSTGNTPHGTNPETKWKIDFQSSNDIKIYRDNNLIYESSAFDFPANEVYLYTYMYSSASQWRYVLFDYIRIRPVTYNFLGILPPIKTDGSSIFKSGSTIPVKFRIADANGNYVSKAIAHLTYQKITDEIPGTIEEPISTSAANEGNTFRYDSTDNLYIFNLGTKGMVTGTYQLNINLDDGTTHTVRISLR